MQFQKYFFAALLLGTCWVACTPHKKLQKPAPEPVAPVRPRVEPVIEKDPLVPFNRDLFNKLLGNQIDIKKVQFYIDQELVLNRYMENGKLEVTNGIIKFVNGKNVNEIVIPANTPCVAEYVEGDAIRVSFDKTGSTFRFQNSRTVSPEFFSFTGINWRDGTCEVDYEGARYRVSCGTCSAVSDAKLMVKQSVVDNNENKSRRIMGNRVGGGF